jgi:hypothetical protein
MVLSYFQDKQTIPLILDNLSFRILPLQRRKDLCALFFINSTGVYKFKSKQLHRIALNYKKFNELQKKVNKNF